RPLGRRGLCARFRHRGAPWLHAIRVDEDVAELVHPPVMTRQNNRGRVHLDYNGRSCDAVACLEPRSLVHRRVVVLTLHVGALAADEGAFGIPEPAADGWPGEFDSLAPHYGPQTDKFVLERKCEREQALMFSIEGL